MGYSIVFFTELTKETNRKTIRTLIREHPDEQNNFDPKTLRDIVERAVKKVWGPKYNWSTNHELTSGAPQDTVYGQVTIPVKTGGENCVTVTTKAEVNRYYSFDKPKEKPTKYRGSGPRIEIGSEQDWQPRINQRNGKANAKKA